MIINSESHLDHGLTAAHIAFLLEQCAGRDAFFIETFELPEELPSVPCGLHGPLVGGAPVPEAEVFYRKRGEREGLSRLCSRPPQQVRQLTVIAGPHGDIPCLLYTAFGGPVAPREPFDAPEEEKQASVEFWEQHALSE